MSRTALRDAVCAELARLDPGEQGDRKALRAAIGCSAVELDGAVDALRFAGKIGFYALVLSESMRAQLAPPPASPAAVREDAGTDRPVLKPAGDRQTSAKEPATAPAPGGREAQPPSAGGRPATGRTPADGDHKRALPPIVSRGPSGEALAAELRAWAARTRTSLNQVSLHLTGHPGMVANVERVARPRASTVERYRAFIAEHPDGWRPRRVAVKMVDKSAGSPASVESGEGLADSLAEFASRAPDPVVVPPSLESPRRRSGRRRQIPLPAGMRPTVEAIQSALAETPEEAMLAVRRRHPELWRRAVHLGRRRGVTPASAFYAALETGLQLEEGRHGDA